MDIKEKHELVECPYDKLHMVEAYRFQRHLMKCGRVHKDMKMGSCSFDATHIIPIHELQYHHTKCPARYRVEKDLMKKDDVVRVEDTDAIVSEECWDNDDELSPVLRKLGGDGFKPVFPKNKHSQRSGADVEQWLANQSEPTEPEVRVPRTRPKAMAGVTGHTVAVNPNKMPQVFLHAIGRGQKLSVPSVPQALIDLGRGRGRGICPSARHLGALDGGYSSDSSSTSNPSPKITRLAADGSSVGHGQTVGYVVGQASPVGRGRARNHDSVLRMSPVSTASEGSEPTNRTVTREPVTVPKGLSRIAASLGQSQMPMGRGSGQSSSLQGSDVGSQPNGDILDEEEKKKLVRKIKKKMSEIEILQKQQRGGKLLDSDQLSKISSLEGYRQHLLKLESM